MPDTQQRGAAPHSRRRRRPAGLGGVNDANLLELGKRAGLRVVLRDDHLLLSGDLKDVERAVPVAQHMVQMARNGVPFGTDDVARYFDAAGSENGVRRLAEAGAGGGARAPQDGAPQVRGAGACTWPRSRRTTSWSASGRRVRARRTWRWRWPWTRCSRSGSSASSWPVPPWRPVRTWAFSPATCRRRSTRTCARCTTRWRT